MKTQSAISNKENDCEVVKKIAPPSQEAKFFEKLLLIIEVFEYFSISIAPPEFVELFSMKTESAISKNEKYCEVEYSITPP